MPVEKKQGDQVFAGTINGEGSLEVRATKNYSDTPLSEIIHLVEEAQPQREHSHNGSSMCLRSTTRHRWRWRCSFSSSRQ
jgi:cation transport ATPase